VHVVYGVQPAPGTVPKEFTQAVHMAAPAALLVPPAHGMHAVALPPALKVFAPHAAQV
jgi:hypothetical protein